MRNSKLVLGLLFLSVISPAVFADSVVPMELASLADLRVSAQTGRLSFRPVPGLSLASLEAKIMAAAAAALAERKVSIRESSATQLYVSVDHELGECGLIAISVRVQLSETVSLHRALPENRKGDFVAITWDRDSLTLVPIDEAEATIIETVEYLVGDFADDVSLARSYMTNSGSN
jgi:hypothetical protein